MDFDATSLYTSPIWDEKSVYLKIETGFAFKPHMNDVYVEAFNNQTFNQDGDKNFKIIPFRKVIEKFFAFRKKYKD